MEVREGLLTDLADAILDGRPIDWGSAESRANELERSLLDPLRLLANLAIVARDHQDPFNSEDELGSEGDRNKDLAGEIVGVYRLIEPLGRGGMGEVYLAERADGRFEQKVALKLVKRGMDSREILRRFARERRILARLEHPGIARLLDAGETLGGRPYFVMERVDGQRITEYCRARVLRLEDRLQLMTACCDAVDAAHRNLVVHRDLKPSNILVTADGQVKLLDFGIAKLLGEDETETHVTRLGGRVLTASYAAPEQILGGNVTVATDVFALGVVLYELLTGVLPYDRGATTPLELAAQVQHETAERPSTAARRDVVSGVESVRQRWARRLRGDLDTITMKALAHEPERRYPSAAALAEDLRRHLTSRPVEARPDSRGYRLRKFVMRHRLGVAASSVVVMAVIAALVVSLYQTAAARREAARAAAAQAFLVSLFEQLDPERYAGSAPTVRHLLERGSERLDQDLAQQPELRAEMQALLARVFDQLSLFKQGESHWRPALQTQQALFGMSDPRTIRAKKGLAISLARQGRYTEAEPLFRELLAQKEVVGDPRELGSMLLNYCNVKRLTGDYAAAETVCERAVALLENVAGEAASRSLATALTSLGFLHDKQGRERDAISALERALAIRLKNGGAESYVVASVKKNLADAHRDLGEFDAAERYAREALTVAEKLLPANDPFVADTLASVGRIVQVRGDRAGARTLYARSIASYEASAHPNNPGLAHPLRSLATLLREDGEAKEALRLSERALALKRKAFGDSHPEVAEFWSDVARGRLALGDVRGALEAFRAGVDVIRVALPDSQQLASELFLLGDVLRRNHRPDEALAYLEESHAIWRKNPGWNPGDFGDLEATIATTRAALR